MRPGNIFNTLIAALAITGLAACGGGGGGAGGGAGGGTNPTGSTVVGSIGGFGSVILSSGVEYNTDNLTSCEVDDVQVSGTCDDSLAVGMNVSLQVDASGAATAIKYDNELKGPALNVTGTAGNFAFDVIGVSVVTTSPGTQWRNFVNNPPLAADLNGVNVEVSGEWQAGILNARYVEQQSDSTHEAKGTVGVVTGSTFPLTLKDGTVIDVDATGVSTLPQSGDYVEVKGSFDGVTFTATNVQIEDEDDFDSDGEAEITGTLVQDGNNSTGFSIGNTDVNFGSSSGCQALVGTVVEAKGTYDQATGVLLVEECEDEDDQLEMKCLAGVVTVDAAAPKAGSVQCTFPPVTDVLTVEFRGTPDLAIFSNDDSLNSFDLNGVNTGDCIEIKASTDASGVHVAGFIERESVAGPCSSYKLKGPVEAFTDNVSITILGVTFFDNANTAYPNGPPVVGNTMKIIDQDGNGVANTVK